MGGRTSFSTIVKAMKIVASARIFTFKALKLASVIFSLRQYYLVQVHWVDGDSAVLSARSQIPAPRNLEGIMLFSRILIFLKPRNVTENIDVCSLCQGNTTSARSSGSGSRNGKRWAFTISTGTTRLDQRTALILRRRIRLASFTWATF